MDYDKNFKDICKKLGLHIYKIRCEKQFSLKEISEKTGIRTEYLRKIESGTAYGVLIERHLLKIAKVLNIKMSELFDI